ISGGSVSTAHAAVVDMAPPGQRARLLGLLGAAFGLGFVAGPAIGGLAALFGERVPLLVAAAIAGVNAVVALRRLPETRPSDTVAHVVEPPPVEGALRRLIVVVFVATSAFTAFEATFALLGQHRFDLTIASTSAVFVGIGLLLVLFQGGLVHPVVGRFGELGAARLALLLNGIGFVLVALAESWVVLVPGVALLTAGQGLLAPTLTSMVAARAHRDRRGSVLGLQQSVSALARVVGPIAGGFLFGHVGVGAPYVAGAVLAMVALAVLLTDVRAEVTAG
ncbi:MAG TPA: MFS transporter, partial [Acidimicrobiales bacterium]|nr:MFS transporter [Acidimicrobiales bacterium]